MITGRRYWLVFFTLLVAGGIALFFTKTNVPADFRPMDAPLTDWSKLHTSAANYYLAEPQTIAEVQALVRQAIASKTPIRMRGMGHSVNAASLPRTNELSLNTHGLRHFERLENDTLLVGAGVTMDGIRQWLETYGYDLPVYNLGGMGPSLGGYISAGGIGEGSAEYGGFWENVAWIGLVDGHGEYRRIGRSDQYFPWLFGSMGQLGVIVEAAIRIVPAPGPTSQPLPVAGRIPELSKSDPLLWERYQKIYETVRLYSVTIFAPAGAEESAARELHAFFEPYQTQIRINRTLTLPIRFLNFNPPLFFPSQEAFTVIGIEFVPLQGAPADIPLEIEIEFAKYISQKGHRHYIQMELTRDPATIAAYFGEKIWGEFHSVKKEFDPLGLMGPGLFSAP